MLTPQNKELLAHFIAGFPTQVAGILKHYQIDAITPEGLQQAYNEHGEQFLNDLFEITEGVNSTKKPDKQEWMGFYGAIFKAGKNLIAGNKQSAAPKPKKSSNTGLFIGLAIIAVIAIIIFSIKKK